MSNVQYSKIAFNLYYFWNNFFIYLFFDKSDRQLTFHWKNDPNSEKYWSEYAKLKNKWNLFNSKWFIKNVSSFKKPNKERKLKMHDNIK